MEDDGLGEEIQVVWELEPGARLIEKVALPDPTGFDPPDQLNAFLDAVRWGASSSADVRNIQSPFRSGIDIEDYQLDPVVRAIQMPRVNLLVADDVGLGKTIEAGMVALELIIRHRARKILIVCPSSLQIQWQEQMRDKFGLDFRIVSSELMRDLRRERGIHVNPWNHFPRLITSIDFLKRERPLRMFREILPGPNDPMYPRKFDLLITDEAHNCAPSGRGKVRHGFTENQSPAAPGSPLRAQAVSDRHSAQRLPRELPALLELLDNQRFARSTKPDRKQLDAVMVRRMKSELPTRWDGSPRFPKRTLEPLEVPYTDEEKAIHAALKQYAGLRSKRARDNAESMATDFVLKTLKKRLFSSPAAFLTTLNKHEASLRHAVKKTAGIEADVRHAQAGHRPDRRGLCRRRGVRRSDGRCRRDRQPVVLGTERPRTDVDQEDAGLGGTGMLPERLESPAVDRLAEGAHPPERTMDGRAGHPLHRVPCHAEVAVGGLVVGGVHRAGPHDDDVRRHGLQEP